MSDPSNTDRPGSDDQSNPSASGMRRFLPRNGIRRLLGEMRQPSLLEDTAPAREEPATLGPVEDMILGNVHRISQGQAPIHAVPGLPVRPVRPVGPALGPDPVSQVVPPLNPRPLVPTVPRKGRKGRGDQPGNEPGNQGEHRDGGKAPSTTSTKPARPVAVRPPAAKPIDITDTATLYTCAKVADSLLCCTAQEMWCSDTRYLVMAPVLPDGTRLVAHSYTIPERELAVAGPVDIASILAYRAEQERRQTQAQG
jgi:hypothetical protein